MKKLSVKNIVKRTLATSTNFNVFNAWYMYMKLYSGAFKSGSPVDPAITMGAGENISFFPADIGNSAERPYINLFNTDITIDGRMQMNL